MKKTVDNPSTKDELMDICDENNNLTGVSKLKSDVYRKGLWHRSSHIWIYNSKGELLIQLRAKNKRLYPDMWDVSAAGGIHAGEDPLTAGLRETQEELGLNVKKDDMKFFRVVKHSNVFRDIKNNEFSYVYFIKFDGDINKLKLQDEEVQKIKFLSVNDIEKELENHPEKYVPHGDYWYDVINEVKRQLHL